MVRETGRDSPACTLGASPILGPTNRQPSLAPGGLRLAGAPILLGGPTSDQSVKEPRKEESTGLFREDQCWPSSKLSNSDFGEPRVGWGEQSLTPHEGAQFLLPGRKRGVLMALPPFSHLSSFPASSYSLPILSLSLSPPSCLSHSSLLHFLPCFPILLLLLSGANSCNCWLTHLPNKHPGLSSPHRLPV